MEVCVDSVASAINAEKGGATRVELCSNLMEGGTTPSLGMLKVVKQSISIPVYVMIRPRGGDFVYSSHELQVMREEIQIFQQHNVDGFVFGVLTKEGCVDKDACRQLLDLCKPKPVTFHRAFDMTVDGEKALEDIISLGFDRLLTSGMEATCLEGLEMLERLVQQAGNRIIIVPGGGITEKNIHRIRACRASEFHCSARSTQESLMTYRRGDIHMGAGTYPPEYSIKTSSSERVRTLLTMWKS